MTSDTDESRPVSESHNRSARLLEPEFQAADKRIRFSPIIVAALVWGVVAAGILVWTALKGS